VHGGGQRGEGAGALDGSAQLEGLRHDAQDLTRSGDRESYHRPGHGSLGAVPRKNAVPLKSRLPLERHARSIRELLEQLGRRKLKQYGLGLTVVLRIGKALLGGSHHGERAI
jgi:hypothetical protein